MVSLILHFSALLPHTCCWPDPPGAAWGSVSATFPMIGERLLYLQAHSCPKIYLSTPIMKINSRNVCLVQHNIAPTVTHQNVYCEGLLLPVMEKITKQRPTPAIISYFKCNLFYCHRGRRMYKHFITFLLACM